MNMKLVFIRWLAGIIDYFIIVFGVTFLNIGIMSILGNGVEDISRFNADDRNLIAIMMFSTYILGYIIYFSVLDSYRYGGSIGKRILRIKVVDKEYSMINIKKCFLRSILKIFISFPLHGYLWCMFNKMQKAPHDYIMKTLVVWREKL